MPTNVNEYMHGPSHTPPDPNLSSSTFSTCSIVDSAICIQRTVKRTEPAHHVSHQLSIWIRGTTNLPGSQTRAPRMYECDRSPAEMTQTPPPPEEGEVVGEGGGSTASIWGPESKTGLLASAPNATHTEPINPPAAPRPSGRSTCELPPSARGRGRGAAGQLAAAQSKQQAALRCRRSPRLTGRSSRQWCAAAKPAQYIHAVRMHERVHAPRWWLGPQGFRNIDYCVLCHGER